VVDMDLVVIVSGIFATTVGYQLMKVFARRTEARGVSGSDLAEIRRRLEAIERAVDSIAIEVERGSEAQRFTVKLLSDRSEGRALP
jgi:hypothetical protein